jgi:hypothetical protein
LNDFAKVAIGYNKECNYVRYLINDEEKFRVNRLGLPIERKYRILEHNIPGELPANAPLVRPCSLAFGFGTFSLMDMYNPQNPGQIDNIALLDLTVGGVLPAVNPIIVNPADSTTIAAQYIVTPYDADVALFGQGAILKIKYVTVYLLANDKENRSFPDLDCYKTKCLFSKCCLNQIEGVNSCSSVEKYCCKGFIENCKECCGVVCDCCPALACSNPGVLGTCVSCKIECGRKKCKKECSSSSSSDCKSSSTSCSSDHKCSHYKPHHNCPPKCGNKRYCC